MHFDIFKLPLFKSELFITFSRALQTGMEEAKIPRYEILERVVLLILTLRLP
jgi:hypothetical protein